MTEDTRPLADEGDSLICKKLGIPSQDRQYSSAKAEMYFRISERLNNQLQINSQSNEKLANRVFLLDIILVIATVVIAYSSIAGGNNAKYQISNLDGENLWRINTQTGEIEVCGFSSITGNKTFCTNIEEKLQGMKGSSND